MIKLTAEEMDSLAQINTLVKIEASSGNDEYFDFRDDGYYTYLRGYGINDELIERIKALSSVEQDLLRQKIEYFAEHPLEIPYQADWKPIQ